MPKVTQLSFISTATEATSFVVSDNTFVRRLNYNNLKQTITQEILSQIPSGGGGGGGSEGTVTSVNFTNANGFTGVVTSNSTTPNITIGTSVVGLLKGNGTGVSAAITGTDFAPPTSGSSILAGNNLGGFSDVIIGNGLSFTDGTLAATGEGSGNVSGPETSSDNAITRFDGVTGKIIKNSLVTISNEGAIISPSVGSVIPFYFANQTSFPDPTIYSGAIAVSAADGKLYFALNGAWIALANSSGSNGGGENPDAGLSARTIISAQTPSINANSKTNLSLTGFSSYMLMIIETSTPAWVVIYTSASARLADASRTEYEDPLPGSGVVAEVITTTGNLKQQISPAVLGFNYDEPITNNIYVSIKNLDSVPRAITCSLTILQLEL